jgi:serine phosphatase RsbU (regulator of sigma subunit)/anti-sigma regulatory factor (Ser/Thr protein kinase)
VASASPAFVSGAGQTGTSVSIEVAVDEHTTALVRAQLSQAMGSHPVADDVRADVNQMVTELLTNVIQHEDARVVSVEAAVSPDGAVLVSVTGGTSEPATLLMHPAGLPDQSSVTGRGLVMLDALSSSWGTRRHQGTTTVWFTVNDAQTASRPGDAVPSLGALMDVSSSAPKDAATRAAVIAEHAALEAAATARNAAQHARAARALAASVAADAVADAAARTRNAVQAQADQMASMLAAAASNQATTVSESITEGDEAEAARRALQVEAAVTSAAAAKAQETARAAALVARDVAAAATAVASTTEAAATAMEREVLEVAQAVQAITTATAERAATDTMERDDAVALATREAGAATQRLHEAHLQLQRAGLHDRMVALALQEAMLTRLPESDDLQLAARYLTAAKQDQVGGDWYDALTLPGATTVVIGDVIGHDIKAAASMGQLRNVLRALVWDRDDPPSAALARLDRANRDLHIDTIATLVIVAIEPPTTTEPISVATLRWSNAGHPGPVLIHADGTVVTLDGATDLLLGVRPGSTRHDHTHPVPPGATLFLYTDGLVETRTEGIDTGQRRLLDTLRTHHQLEPAELLDAVLTDMVGNQPDDDVAVLAVRFSRHATQPGNTTPAN